jgi:hypothetical protein
MLAALEGALILARTRPSPEPLDKVERFFASRAGKGRPASHHSLDAVPTVNGGRSL